MKIAFLKMSCIFYVKTTWLKCANPCCDDKGMCMMNLFVSSDYKMTLILFLDLKHFLLKTNVRVKAFELFIKIVHQLLTRNFWKAGNIVNIFLRV
ncbi:hypothetical protein D1872_285960 [compost metagenome]